MGETTSRGSGTAQTFARDYLAGLKKCLDSLSLERIETIISILAEAYHMGRHVFIIGNGGSAAIASHMACDLNKTILGSRLEVVNKRFRAIALTDNIPLITAWANDTQYKWIFAEQLKNLANEGDLLIAISGSGNSANIVEAVRVAKTLGLRTVGILGFDGGQVKGLVDECLIAESNTYGYVEDIHMVLDHLITAYFEKLIVQTS